MSSKVGPFRVLCSVMLKLSHTLSQIGTGIKDAYLGSAGLLHRDVGVDNMMFVFVDKEPGIKGVLTGWDHSVQVTKLTSTRPPSHSVSGLRFVNLFLH